MEKRKYTSAKLLNSRRVKAKPKKKAADAIDISGMSPDEMKKLVHALHARQNELIMKNEALLRIQNELEMSRDKYFKFYEFSPTGYFVIDDDGIIKDVNHTGAAMLGVEQTALTGKPFTCFILKDDHALFNNHKQSLFDTRMIQSCELRLVKKDGSGFYAHLECVVGNDTGGDFRQIRVSVIDITEQKKTDMMANESQRRFSNLMGNLPGMAYRCRHDDDWTMEFASEGCFRLTGYQSEDLIGNRKISYGQLIHPDDRKYVWADVQEAIGQRKPFQLQYRINTIHNKIKWVWEQGTGIYSDQGDLLALEGFITDIDEQKKTREARIRVEDDLKKSESLLNEVCRIAKTGGWEMDIITGKAKWTQGTYDIVEIERDRPAPGLDEHLDYYLPEFRSIVKDAMDRLIADNVPMDFEAQLKTAKGNIRWCRVMGTGIRSNGKCIKARGILYDITEQKQSFNIIQKEKDRAQQYLDVAGVMIIGLNVDGIVFLINKKGCRILECGEDEIIGKNWFDNFIPPQNRDNVRAVFFELMHGNIGPVEYFENSIVTCNGLTKWIAWHNSLIKDENDKITGILSSGEDITERRQADAELRQSQYQLRALALRLQDIEEKERKEIAMELHDQVGAMLTGLNINLNIIRKQLSADASGALFERLDDSINLVEDVTRKIRNIMADLRPPILDDHGLIAGLRWYGSRFAERTGILFELFGCEPSPRFPGEVESACFRIAQEALANVTRHSHADRVTITVKEDEKLLRIEITDNGKGFDYGAVVNSGNRGWGIINMEERAHAIGGTIGFESAGNGTHITIEVRRKCGAY